MGSFYENIILGAGASGLMTAALLGDGSDTLVIDRNPDAGRKISISGGGRCNFTNSVVSAVNYLGENSFVASVLKRFDQNDLLDWFGARGLKSEIRKNGQYFCAGRADDIIDILRSAAEGVSFAFSAEIGGVKRENGYFVVSTSRGEYRSRKLVVACGGASYPKAGASSVGLKIANSFGHKSTDFFPALTGFTLQPDQFFFKDLSGISVMTEVSVGGRLFRDMLLFAHRGISGPVILNASLWWRKGDICIDFVPGFDWSSLEGSAKTAATLLPLPKRAAIAFLKHLGVENRAAGSMRSEEKDRLRRLSSYCFSPAGRFGFSRAEVSGGGVAVQEIDPDSMMSRKVDGLYFIGEVLDVTGELGGYNFQWAFSSAYVCAQALNAE